jgi:hypothetical protein
MSTTKDQWEDIAHLLAFALEEMVEEYDHNDKSKFALSSFHFLYDLERSGQRTPVGCSTPDGSILASHGVDAGSSAGNPLRSTPFPI